MPTFVKGYSRAGKLIKGYTKNVGFKKGLSKTGRIHKALSKTSAGLGFANMSGNVKRAKTLKSRMGKIRSYMIGQGL
jgi:hypothetical protein